ncbi:hypothetical protein AGMMS49942_25190 [Spirochaetia bacterium]|nr:hypothetical protein AGMMS49942_25190 [Spirochaetia bacterium]
MTPVEATVTPVEATVTPVEATVTPVEATVTPVEATVTPVEATVTPVEATVTPVEPSAALGIKKSGHWPKGRNNMFLGIFDMPVFDYTASLLTRVLMISMASPDTPPSPHGYPRWMPNSRTEQLALGRKWSTILAIKGSAWLIPTAETDKHEARTNIAGAALAITTDPNGCTRSQTTACKVAFFNMREQMMFLKDRYLLVPPLTEAEAEEMGVTRNHAHAAVPNPRGILQIVVLHTGPGQVRLLVTHLPGSPVDRDGVADTREIHWELVDPNGTVFSIDPEEFNHTIINKNKYITINLPPGSIGKLFRVAGRYLNAHGGQGPWSSIVEAIVS